MGLELDFPNLALNIPMSKFLGTTNYGGGACEAKRVELIEWCEIHLKGGVWITNDYDYCTKLQGLTEDDLEQWTDYDWETYHETRDSSLDQVCVNLSFEFPDDAIIFKLTWI